MGAGARKKAFLAEWAMSLSIFHPFSDDVPPVAHLPTARADDAASRSISDKYYHDVAAEGLRSRRRAIGRDGVRMRARL